MSVRSLTKVSLDERNHAKSSHEIKQFAEVLERIPREKRAGIRVRSAVYAKTGR